MFDIHLHRKPKKLPKRIVYNYNKGDFAALRESLKLLPLTDIVLSEDDIDIAWTKCCNTFLAVVNTFIPRKANQQILYPTIFYKRDCSPSTSKRNYEKTGKEIGFCNNLGEISRSAQES